MATSTRVSGFRPGATHFFEDLEDQNTREFWLANKEVFDREVREPMAALLDSLPEEYQPFKRGADRDPCSVTAPPIVGGRPGRTGAVEDRAARLPPGSSTSRTATSEGAYCNAHPPGIRTAERAATAELRPGDL